MWSAIRKMRQAVSGRAAPADLAWLIESSSGDSSSSEEEVTELVNMIVVSSLGSPEDDEDDLPLPLLRVPRWFFEDRFALQELAEEADVTEAVWRHWWRRMVRDSDEPLESVPDEAMRIYCCIHARYLATEDGLDHLYRAVCSNSFGTCPRSGCKYSPLLPSMMPLDPSLPEYKEYQKDEVKRGGIAVKVCSSCNELYSVPQGSPGFAFGSTAAWLLIQDRSDENGVLKLEDDDESEDG